MTWFILLILGFFAGCSGLVAPTNKSTVSGVLTETGGEVDSTDGTADGTTDGTADGTTDGTADGTTDGTADGTTDGGGRTPIGSFSGISGDLEFTPKSAFAIATTGATGNFSVTVYDKIYTEDDLTKKVASYECVECGEGDCEEGATSKYLSVLMMDYTDYADPVNPVAVDVINDNAMPVEDSYQRLAPNAQGLMITFSDGTTTLSGGKETGNVATFATKPAAVGDEFELTLDATFVASTDTDFAAPQGTYKITVKTKVIEQVTQTVEAPDCADGEYAKATYED